MPELMYTVIDVETENTGTDVKKDNKRILSVQIGDAFKQNLYYQDSRNQQYTLVAATKQISALLSQGYTFTGYYIKEFDIPMLKQFLRIEVPESKLLDLSQTPRAAELKKKGKYRLEDVCKECGVGVSHKKWMNEKAEKYKERQDIRDQARAKANEDMKKGGTFDYWYNLDLKRIAAGNAILDAYRDFVESGGRRDTLFYDYAIGDVICEYRLLKALGY
jgi:phage regulator Rha-like protein